MEAVRKSWIGKRLARPSEARRGTSLTSVQEHHIKKTLGKRVSDKQLKRLIVTDAKGKDVVDWTLGLRPKGLKRLQRGVSPLQDSLNFQLMKHHFGFHKTVQTKNRK